MLKELPKSLDETYQRILKEINNANHKQAHQLLQCLAVAKRPLRVEELAEVLALDVEAGGIATFNENWRWEDHEAAVLSACSSLVSVNRYTLAPSNGWPRRIRCVQFSHFSVKEFLTSDRLASMGDVSRFHIAHEPSHLFLAQACIGVILSIGNRTSEDDVEDIALLSYADQYGGTHAQAGKEGICIKDGLDCLFDVAKPHFEALLRRIGLGSAYQCYRVPSDEDPRSVLTPAAPFYLASVNGLSGLAERLIITNRTQLIRFRSEGWSMLHRMVDLEYIEFARLLLAYGADINSRIGYATPPHIPSLQSHVKRPADQSLDVTDEVENGLQNSGADMSSKELANEGIRGHLKDSGFTPLHLAVSKGYLDMCQMLLEHKADVCAHEDNGDTPLHFAASRGHLEVARMLLEHKADVNALNEEGSTPLQDAFEGRKGDIVRLLLNHGADAKVLDKSGNTLLHLAAMEGDLELTRILLEHVAEVTVVNSQNNDGSTAFLLALEKKNFGVALLLLDHKLNVHIPNKHGNSPIHAAALNGQLDICRVLLKRNVEVNSQNNYGSTPLLLALMSEAPDLVQLLLEHNADVHVRNVAGDTLLHCAAIAGRLEVVRLVLKLDVDVNSRNERGFTPLHLASVGYWEGNPDVVRLLLDHGADTQAQNLSGKTPSEVARGPKRQEIVQLLSEHAAA